MMEQASGGGTVIAFGLASSELHAARIARLTAAPSQVVLIDPTLDPEAPSAHLLAGTRGTTLIDALPGPTQGEAEFLVWSVRGLTGLQQPTPALMDLLPGLRCKSRRMVPMRSVADLAENLRDLPAPLTVWIDLPGAEGGILDALFASDLGEQVRAIRVRATIEAFFEGGHAASDLVTKLAAQGFNLTGQDDTDPDFPDLNFEIDRQALRIDALASKLQARRDAALTMSRQLAALENQLRDGLAARDTRLAELEAEHQKTLQERHDAELSMSRELAELKDATQEHEAARARSGEEIAARDARLAETEAQLKAALQAHYDAELNMSRQLAELEEEARTTGKAQAETEEMLREELSQSKAHGDALEAELRAEIATRDTRLAELEARLETAATERDAAQAQAEAEIATRDTRLAELEAQLETVTTERDAAQAQAEAEIATRDTRLAELETQLETARAQSEQEIAARDARISRLEGDCESLRSEQGFSLRLRTMMQLDMDALRSRFEASETQRLQQEALLRKLTAKLGQAAEHLEHLKLVDAPRDMSPRKATIEARNPDADNTSRTRSRT